MVEHQIVILAVAGSSPVFHPSYARNSAVECRSDTAKVVGSNPTGRTMFLRVDGDDPRPSSNRRQA